MNLLTDLPHILIGRTTEMFDSKIVIYDQARVNGESNYEYPGKLWVLKLVHHNKALILLKITSIHFKLGY